MATSASAVKEAVKETVLGSDDAAGPSSQSKARFTKRAVKDETGELIMGPDEFINAVAPENEDFVSLPVACPLALVMADPIAPVCCCAMGSRACVVLPKSSLRE